MVVKFRRAMEAGEKEEGRSWAATGSGEYASGLNWGGEASRSESGRKVGERTRDKEAMRQEQVVSTLPLPLPVCRRGFVSSDGE